MYNFIEVMHDINVHPLLDQIAAHPELWNTNSVRTSQHDTVHYDVDDIILRYPGRGLLNWNLEPFNILTAAQPMVFALAGKVRCEVLGRVVISRLGPGKVIPTHQDRLAGIPMFYQRYQVPLVCDEGVIFHCADERLWMRPGSAYWFANTLDHSVVNGSDRDRLSMIIDIRPFTPQ